MRNVLRGRRWRRRILLPKSIGTTYWDALFVRDGVLYKKWEAPNLRKEIFQLVTPKSQVKRILEEEWCKTCKVCSARKGPPKKGKSPLQVYNVGAPFERVQMDVLGPLPVTSSGNKYLLVVVDCFSKWVEAVPLKNIRSKTIAEAFLNQIISRHGVPLEVHTDQGRNFESRVFRELSHILGIKKTRTTPLHPQTSKHETTGVSPAELYLAQDLRLPMDLLRGNPPDEERSDSFEGYSGKVKRRLEELHEDVRKRLDIKSSQTKSWYDQKTRRIDFEVGQRVWLYNPRRIKGKAPKLQCSWEGPYSIVKKLSEVVYCIHNDAALENISRSSTSVQQCKIEIQDFTTEDNNSLENNNEFNLANFISEVQSSLIHECVSPIQECASPIQECASMPVVDQFSIIQNLYETVTLPTKLWFSQVFSDKIIWAQWGDQYNTAFRVTLLQDMNLQIFIEDRRIYVPGLEKIKTITEMSAVLRRVSTLLPCGGVGIGTEGKTIECSGYVLKSKSGPQTQRCKICTKRRTQVMRKLRNTNKTLKVKCTKGLKKLKNALKRNIRLRAKVILNQYL
ncbi:PREDICTED: uncharacterized protein LOC108761002 [Trachymyrmex cornetzi]|uniref:uncharacterized protein LOC108761002 n=1 Tax=Trachymyrmex cornetzi TaxID=471704 RepID=UPI00084F1B29|nr:PREDICTED: uncharacterized protein LOC108761002 [Trachymyrmex cornetzi]